MELIKERLTESNFSAFADILKDTANMKNKSNSCCWTIEQNANGTKERKISTHWDKNGLKIKLIEESESGDVKNITDPSDCIDNMSKQEIIVLLKSIVDSERE